MKLSKKTSLDSAAKIMCFFVSFFLMQLNSNAFGALKGESLPALVVAYGIEVNCFYHANVWPTVVIEGTLGTSEPVELKHDSGWKEGRNYFVIPAESLGRNVGWPKTLTFKARADDRDSLRFSVILVDYFGKEGRNMTYLSSVTHPQNDRSKALHGFDGKTDWAMSGDRISTSLTTNGEVYAINHVENMWEGRQYKTTAVVQLPAIPVDPEETATIAAASHGWLEVPLNKVSGISLIKGGKEITITLGDSVEGRLMTSEQKEKSSEQSATASVSVEFKSKSNFHEASVKAGLSATAAQSVTTAVKTEMDKTMKETSSWSQKIICPPTERDEVIIALTQQIMRIREFPRSVTVGANTLFFQERRDYENTTFLGPYKTHSPELKAKWTELKEKYPRVKMSTIEYDNYVSGAPTVVVQSIVSQLPGSRWTYKFGASTFEFEFAANSIKNFSNGWWPGVTWQANGDNQIILNNSPTAEASALPPGPAAVGKQMTIRFDSADSYTGTDFDGVTAISGHRIR